MSFPGILLLLTLSHLSTAAPFALANSPTKYATPKNLRSIWSHTPFIAAPDPNQSCASNLGRPGAVYFCPEANFANTSSQTCAWQAQMGICITSAEGNEPAASVGPDPGTYCDLYGQKDCKGSVVKRLECPGFKSSAGKRFFSSMVCWDIV
ncbi:hypothetical protein HBI56_015650 [Parastagonospora nodorum]|nr:hypothetical protein HBI05_124930 [Parastagonospora nodorum]KAH4238240.1 hypothetical protein HBI06_043040 [Parastagonospora nodorum]KAH4911902.1 hypothetical protein HBI80_013210 [Parastagonospora nodorum]KAH4972008.1 hypothetical protein HBI78_021350 [Parastagonospora nodorum]KAH5036316.1 hypothetical protein HBI74_049430 [Parastagonospora nodorum]